MKTQNYPNYILELFGGKSWVEMYDEKELEILLAELESQPRENLKKLLEQQKISEKHVNSRPGAMALSQNKIKLFNEYNKKYIQTIKEKLEF